MNAEVITRGDGFTMTSKAWDSPRDEGRDGARLDGKTMRGRRLMCELVIAMLIALAIWSWIRGTR